MPGDLLTIGELARRTGRRASAIRYYEEIGLLAEPIRVSGQRRYDHSAVRNLAVIDTCQRAGLPLNDIRLLLEAAPGQDTAAIQQLRRIAERTLPELAASIERAILVRSWLEAAAQCECPSLDDCCLFDHPALPAQAVGERNSANGLG